MFLAWKKTCVKKVKRIITQNFRLQAAILEFEKCRLLILNTYFPCDSQKLDLTLDETVELTNLFQDISSLLHEYDGAFDVPVILGDLNFDNLRFTAHTQMINQFMEENSFFTAWEMFPIDFTFSNNQSRSTIDHFLLPDKFASTIIDARVVHDSENMSGHAPIYLQLDLLKSKNPVEKVERPPRLNWFYSTKEQRQQ